MSETKLGYNEAYSLKTPEDSKKLYKKWAETYDEGFALKSNYVSPEKISKYFNQYSKNTDSPILDVGAGTGLVGEYLNLKTIYAPYTKGVFDGIAKGKVLPIGGDYPLYYQENGKTFSDLDIDMVLLTEDNEKIYCKASGVFNYVTETFESLKFQTHWRFRTSSEKYKYLNDVMGIGFGSVLSADSEYNFQHDIYDVHLK